MSLRNILASICLAALGACASHQVVEPEPAGHVIADEPISADVTATEAATAAGPADVDADMAAVPVAAAPVKPRSRPAGPALSFAELKSCATLLIDANRHGETLQSRASELLAERQRLYEAQRALRRHYQALNGMSKEAASDYAAREKDLANTTDHYKLKVGLYGASLRNFKATKKQYRNDCAYRPYSGRDLAALADGERAEMKKGFLAFKLPRL